jgi:uncharacterized membrane protein
MDNSQSTRRRLVFLDVLRLIAAVQMIQGHSVASVLAPSYRSGAAFGLWTFARGLTSVTFLTTAGLAFVLAEARGSDRDARHRRVRRALRLIAIGYLMHAPFGVFLGAPLEPTLRAALQVDVLQCIGASLLGLELLSFAVRSATVRAVSACALGLGLFALAPVSQQLAKPALGLPLALGNYLTMREGSLFPLLPWAGYVLVGFGVGTRAFAPGANPARVLALSGAVVLPLGLLTRAQLEGPSAASHPGYALVKLGCVLLLSGLLAHLLRSVSVLPSLLSRVAKQTLFLYVSHVVILYADFVGLERHLRGRHGPATGLLLTLALLVLCSASALAFESLRRRARGGTRAAPSP